MIYEDQTFEAIMDRMLNVVKEVGGDIDVREGSIIYNALAPAAVELANAYIEMDAILNETFADTASREFLIKRAAERGLVPKEATKAIRKGEFNIDIPIGSRFSINQLNYIAIEKISDGVFKLECETFGNIGNVDVGTLIPIDYIEGLTSAELTDVLIPGEDEEETEELRKRFFENLNSQAFGGNIADYKEKTNSLNGVGGVKVIPIWNGGGTVKLIIINSTYSKPSQSLIDEIQNKIDPTQNGDGVGIAPIGHIVTVEACNETEVNISTNVLFENGWDWGSVEPYAIETINNYFNELARDWADSENLVVRVSQIETRLLNLTGILDVSNTSLNGNNGENLVIEENNIPKLGAIDNV